MHPDNSLRNQSIDLAKLIASFFILFIHAPFPGTFGNGIASLSRFAVPFFFAVSGYFSFRISAKKIARRIWYVLRLELIGIFLYLLWRSGYTLYTGGSLPAYWLTLVPTARMFLKWAVLNLDPYATHLWYLPALLFCYGVLYLYTRFFGSKPVYFQPFYIAGVLLTAVHFVLDELATVLGVPFPFMIYQNGLLTGLPMFALGIFLREYREQIMENFNLNARKLWGFLLLGSLLSIMEWSCFGVCIFYCGTILMVLSLMLLVSSYPEVSHAGSATRLTGSFGAISTIIYIVHPIFVEFYLHFVHGRLVFYLEDKAAWLGPLLIAAACFLLSAVCAALHLSLRRFSRAK